MQAAQQVGFCEFVQDCHLWVCLRTSGFVQVQAKAQAMATALQTIGKFTIRKKSESNKEVIFGRSGRANCVTLVQT